MERIENNLCQNTYKDEVNLDDMHDLVNKFSDLKLEEKQKKPIYKIGLVTNEKMLYHYPGTPPNKEAVIENEGYYEIPERLSIPLKHLKAKKITELCEFIDDYELCSDEYINFGYQTSKNETSPDVFSNMKNIYKN